MRKPLSLLLLALFTAACAKPPEPAPVPPPAQETTPAETDRAPGLIAEAQRLQAAGDRIAARQRLTEAHALAAGNPDLLAQVAAATLNQDFHGAIELAREALQLAPGHAQASLVLGSALLLLDQPDEARPYLERAYAGTDRSLEAGLQLALALESLGELTAARSLLAELQGRMPQSDEVKQASQRLAALRVVWPAPGAPGTPVADWAPERWLTSSELLVGLRDGEQTIVSLGWDGKLRWSSSCGGQPISDMVWDESSRRLIAFTATQGCLIDGGTGRVLVTTPPTANTMWGFAWRGDQLAFSAAVRPEGVPPESPGYFGTDWQVFRLTESGGVVSLEPLYTARDGSRAAALSRDGRILFSWLGNHGAGRPRLFRDGRKVTEYERLEIGAEFALDPRDDRFYFVSYDGEIQALTLDGDVLWRQQPGAMHVPFDLWPDDQGHLLIVVKLEGAGFDVYDDQGQRQWGGEGWPAAGNPLLLVARQPRETWLLDRQGAVVARYPYGTYFTRDGKALLRKSGRRLLLYRVP